jgi:hypothetical protein
MVLSVFDRGSAKRRILLETKEKQAWLFIGACMALMIGGIVLFSYELNGQVTTTHLPEIPAVLESITERIVNDKTEYTAHFKIETQPENTIDYELGHLHELLASQLNEGDRVMLKCDKIVYHWQSGKIDHTEYVITKFRIVSHPPVARNATGFF